MTPSTAESRIIEILSKMKKSGLGVLNYRFTGHNSVEDREGIDIAVQLDPRFYPSGDLHVKLQAKGKHKGRFVQVHRSAKIALVRIDKIDDELLMLALRFIFERPVPELVPGVSFHQMFIQFVTNLRIIKEIEHFEYLGNDIFEVNTQNRIVRIPFTTGTQLYISYIYRFLDAEMSDDGFMIFNGPLAFENAIRFWALANAPMKPDPVAAFHSNMSRIKKAIENSTNA